jgi:hypothetical protein
MRSLWYPQPIIIIKIGITDNSNAMYKKNIFIDMKNTWSLTIKKIQDSIKSLLFLICNKLLLYPIAQKKVNNDNSDNIKLILDMWIFLNLKKITLCSTGVDKIQTILVQIKTMLSSHLIKLKKRIDTIIHI